VRGPARALRSFGAADLAVSPVIATILMVAITVVLAATAFVLVADVGGNAGNTAPAIGFRVNDALDHLEVTSAGPKADWKRISVRLLSDDDGGSVYVGDDPVPYVNKAATTNGGLISSPVAVATDPQPIAGGDYLAFCGSGTDGPITLQVTDTDANSLVGTFGFSDLAPC
jgi:flagellin-like protein